VYKFLSSLGEILKSLPQKNTRALRNSKQKKTFAICKHRSRKNHSRTTPWTSKMRVVESMCLLAANVQAGNISLKALSNSWTWYLMYQSTKVICMSLFRSTFPSLLILRVDGLLPQRPDLAPSPLVLLVAVTQRYIDVLRMDHCTDWHHVHQ
jgi:hypothetical protein